MRRALLACTALLLGCGAASAQVVVETPATDVYVEHRSYVERRAYGPPDTVHIHRYRAPRTYEYTRVYEDDDDDDDVVVIDRGPRGCGGPYRWNGDRCVYVRY